MLRHQCVHTCGAFGSRTSRIVEKLGSCGTPTFSIALRCVEQRRETGTVQLVAGLHHASAMRMADIGQQRCHSRDEFQFGAMDIKFLMIELHEGILILSGYCLKDLFLFVLRPSSSSSNQRKRNPRTRTKDDDEDEKTRRPM